MAQQLCMFLDFMWIPVLAARVFEGGIIISGRFQVPYDNVYGRWVASILCVQLACCKCYDVVINNSRYIFLCPMLVRLFAAMGSTLHRWVMSQIFAPILPKMTCCHGFSVFQCLKVGEKCNRYLQHAVRQSGCSKIVLRRWIYAESVIIVTWLDLERSDCSENVFDLLLLRGSVCTALMTIICCKTKWIKLFTVIGCQIKDVDSTNHTWQSYACWWSYSIISLFCFEFWPKRYFKSKTSG